MDDREKVLLIVGTGALIVFGLRKLLDMPKKNRDHEDGQPKPSPKPQRRQPGYAQPPRYAYARDPAAALVIPARNADVVEEMRRLGREGSGPDELLAERLNEDAWGLWYGSRYDGNFEQLESLARESQPDDAVNVSLGFVICLFYLTRPNRNFEAGTIGRRYDGVMELAQPGAVERVIVSSPVSVTRLGSVTLTRV
jgi:hypothetical protein